MKRDTAPTAAHPTGPGIRHAVARISVGLVALAVVAVPVACSDDDPTDVVDGSESVDAGESTTVDSQADLACLNAFDAAANDQAPLSTTLEACADADQWYDVATQYPTLVPADQADDVLDALCAQSDETLETVC